MQSRRASQQQYRILVYHLTSSRQGREGSRGIEKLQLSITAASQPVHDLSASLVVLRQLIVRDLGDGLAGIHALDEVGLLHVAVADVVGPRHQRRVLVVVQDNGLAEGVGQAVLVLL